jgi:hypothetical protein
MANEILIPVRRRHAATRAQLETMVTYPQHWGYAEDEELTLTRLISGARRYSSRSALCRPQTMFDPIVNVDTHDCVGINTLTQLNNVGSAAGDFYVDAGTTGLHIKSRQTTYGDTAFLILEGYGEGANGHSEGYDGTKLIMCSSLSAANQKMFLIGSGGSFIHFDSLNDDKTINQGDILVLNGYNSNVGIGTGHPDYTLDVYRVGVVKQVLDMIRIQNDVYDADMIGTGVGIKFDLTANGNIRIESGKISVYCEQNMSGTWSTQDATMAFATCLNGVLTDKMLLNSVGQALFTDGNIIIPSISFISNPTSGISLDGGQLNFSSVGNHTFNFDTFGYMNIMTAGAGISFQYFTHLQPITTAWDGGLELMAGDVTNGARLRLSTREDGIVVNYVLGRISFCAPYEDSGGDANLDGASIVAIAEDTFSATVNKTSLVFQTGISEVATTKMILNSAGNLGIGAAVVFDASAVGCLALANATAPGAHTDNQIYIYSADVNCGTLIATLALYTEHAVRTEYIETTSTLPIMINGSPYMLLLGTIPV